MIKRITWTLLGAWLLSLIVAALWFGPNLLPAQTAANLPSRPAVMQTPAKLIGSLALTLGPLATLTVGMILFLSPRLQRQNNEALSAVGTYQWIATPASDKTQWQGSAADMWARMRTPLQGSEHDLLRGRVPHASLEVIALEGRGVAWGLWSPDVSRLVDHPTQQDLPSTLASILRGSATRTYVSRTADPLATLSKRQGLSAAWVEMGLSAPSHYAIQTDFNTDPFISVVSTFQTNRAIQAVGMQVIVRPVTGWQRAGQQELAKQMQKLSEVKRSLVTAAEQDKRMLLEAKLDQSGFDVVLRFYVIGTGNLGIRLKSILDVLGQYQSSLNGFTVTHRGDDMKTLIDRAFTPRLAPQMVLNVNELAALYHLPRLDWAPLGNITWAPSAIIQPAMPVIVGWGKPISNLTPRSNHHVS